MSENYYTFKFPKEDNQKNKNIIVEEILKYEKGNYTNIGINLCELSMIKSSQIGFIARIIKASDKKGKKTVIYAATNVLYDILTTVHFDKKAQIVLDEGDFIKALIDQAPSGKERAQKVEKPKSKNFTTFLFSKIREKLSVIIIIILLLIVLGLGSLASFLFLQHKNLKVKNVTQCVLFQKKLDSLSNVIKLYKVEEELMNEINSATIEEKK